MQGNVAALVDDKCVQVIKYHHDAWGAPLSKTGSLANTIGTLNPFRYRGYVYDEETGLYYLRSRYYNPVWKRFLNSDELIGYYNSIFSHNVFCYCMNATVNAHDPDGHFLKQATTFLNVMNTAVGIAKFIVSAIGAEVQLVVNRTKAKRMLNELSNKQLEHLVAYPYGGAENALFEGIAGKYSWFYNQVNHNAPMDYKREARRPWWTLGEDTFYFRGKMIDLETYGNVNYGYVGKALNIPDWILFAGGGFAAVIGGETPAVFSITLIARTIIIILHGAFRFTKNLGASKCYIVSIRH